MSEEQAEKMIRVLCLMSSTLLVITGALGALVVIGVAIVRSM